MKKICQVSYPRSGTQILQFLLFTYFTGNLYFPFSLKNKKINLIDKFINDNPINNTDYLSIEQILKFYYEGETTYNIGEYKFSHISNATEDCNFIHWHGEEGDLNKNDIFIIQYRHPVYAIMSMFNYEIKDENMDYAKEMVIKWKAFVRKWVLENLNKNSYKIRYLDLISEPKKHLINILKLIGEEINEPFVEAIINVHKIKPYFKDKKIFSKEEKEKLRFIEEECSEEMRILKFERILL